MEELSTVRLYLLRGMYLLIAVGMGIQIWPLIVNHPAGVEHMRGGSAQLPRRTHAAVRAGHSVSGEDPTALVFRVSVEGDLGGVVRPTALADASVDRRLGGHADRVSYGHGARADSAAVGLRVSEVRP